MLKRTGTFLLVSCMWLAGVGQVRANVRLVHLTSNVNVVEMERLHQAAQRFTAAHPVITIDFVRASSAQDRIDKMIMFYSAGIMPDVIELQPEIAYEFALSGYFLDLNPFMQKEANLKWEDFVTPAVVSVTLPEKLSKTQMRWMLPESVWLIGTVFNVDMFNEAGIEAPTSLDKQWTWADFRAIGKKLLRTNASGAVTRYGAEVNRANNRWPAWVHNAGGWYLDQYYYPTESRLTTEPVRTALQFLRDIYLVDAFATWDSAKWSIEKLNVAIGMHAGPNYTSRYVSRGATNQYAIGPWPKLVRGGCEMTVQGRVIGAQTKAPDIAWEWIKYLSTNLEAITDMMRQTSYIPAWRRGMSLYTNSVASSSPWEHVWLDLVMHPDSYVRGIYSSEVRDTMQKYVEAITNGKIGVNDGLIEADRAVTAILTAIYR